MWWQVAKTAGLTAAGSAWTYVSSWFSKKGITTIAGTAVAGNLVLGNVVGDVNAAKESLKDQDYLKEIQRIADEERGGIMSFVGNVANRKNDVPGWIAGITATITGDTYKVRGFVKDPNGLRGLKTEELWLVDGEVASAPLTKEDIADAKKNGRKVEGFKVPVVELEGTEMTVPLISEKGREYAIAKFDGETGRWEKNATFDALEGLKGSKLSRATQENLNPIWDAIGLDESLRKPVADLACNAIFGEAFRMDDMKNNSVMMAILTVIVGLFKSWFGGDKGAYNPADALKNPVEFQEKIKAEMKDLGLMGEDGKLNTKIFREDGQMDLTGVPLEKQQKLLGVVEAMQAQFSALKGKNDEFGNPVLTADLEKFADAIAKYDSEVKEHRQALNKALDAAKLQSQQQNNSLEVDTGAATVNYADNKPTYVLPLKPKTPNKTPVPGGH